MPVTPSDIAVELGRPTPAPESVTYQQWAQWIADAMTLIQAEADRREVALSDLDPTVVDLVVRSSVASHALQPTAATQVSISVDDGSVSKSFAAGAGRVSIADALWALLFPGSTTGAFTITPAFVQPDQVAPWWWVNGPVQP